MMILFHYLPRGVWVLSRGCNRFEPRGSPLDIPVRDATKAEVIVMVVGVVVVGGGGDGGGGDGGDGNGLKLRSS